VRWGTRLLWILWDQGLGNFGVLRARLHSSGIMEQLLQVAYRRPGAVLGWLCDFCVPPTLAVQYSSTGCRVAHLHGTACTMFFSPPPTQDVLHGVHVCTIVWPPHLIKCTPSCSVHYLGPACVISEAVGNQVFCAVEAMACVALLFAARLPIKTCSWAVR
jgi:hypothetical protein